MNITDIIVIVVIALIIGLALNKLIKDKRLGKKCSGCPYAGACTTCSSDNIENIR